MNQDIFLRAHTVAPTKSVKELFKLIPEKWPTKILVFDTETTIDTRQEMTFGVYQLCELIDGNYVVAEEGLFYADDLDTRQRKAIKDYAKANLANIEKKSFPPKLELKVYSRWEFVERVLWKAVKHDRLIVGFNLPFDLSRLAVRWSKADNDGWSLTLSQRISRKTKTVEANPHRPRVTINAPFIATTKPEEPSEWPQARFLDLHTLAFALYGESESLDRLCGRLGIPGKIKHEPSGKVTNEEIHYCRGDVSATTRALNEVKREFDQHPIQLYPTKAYSPASIAKAYLDAMGVAPPKDKFHVPNDLLGIAMQAYYGGRAECRLRKVPVPVIHTDFKSQYPTVNTLLGNWNVLTAENLSFDDATDEVRSFLEKIKLDDLFNPRRWKDLSFFALVRPDRDIFPIRTVYNGTTQNIGINELSSTKPIWFAGPDIVASVLLSGRVPQIEKAIRMVPHGRQEGLRPTNLRGMVKIDPRKHDFFKCVVEQRENHKSNKILGDFLKDVANAGSYGLFVEINPDKKAKPVTISVFSGQKSFQQKSQLIEKHGKWYFPPVAALITAGGRLLLAMLERSVRGEGGTYLFCDTDSLCIVAAERGSLLPCPGGEHKLPSGKEAVKVLSRKQVQTIADKFKALNPYDPTVVPEILKIETVNFDSKKKWRQLTGFAISAKRYSLYQMTKSKLKIVNPKAHGLGYLYPPIETKEGDPHWTFEAWEWMLRGELGLTRTIPKWIDLPAMMRIVLSTPHVLNRLDHLTRPYNFLFCPLIDSVAGYPANVEPQHCTVIAPFTKKREDWISSQCINVCDGKVYQLALTQSNKLDKLIPQTFGYVLRLYLSHPEAKSLAPDGAVCTGETRGLLKRASVIAKGLRYVGKETDRRWVQGEDLSLLTFSPIEYQPEGKVTLNPTLRQRIDRCGVRTLIRQTGLSQHTIEAIRAGNQVRRSTLERIQVALEGESKGVVSDALQEPRV